MKKTKKKASKKTSTSKRRGFKLETVQINLDAQQRGYVAELAEYACTNIETVCAVMMACGIFKARRFELPLNEKAQNTISEQAATILEQEAKLMRCRQIMEVNDPGNARDIFGEPAPAPAAEPASP
jgi:hypothetical protein